MAGIVGMIYGYGEVRNCVNTAPRPGIELLGLRVGHANQQSTQAASFPTFRSRSRS